MSSYFDDDEYESDTKNSSDNEEEEYTKKPSSISKKKEIKLINQAEDDDDDSIEEEDDEVPQFGGVADFPEDDDVIEDNENDDDIEEETDLDNNMEEDPESSKIKIKQIPENAIYNKDDDDEEDDDDDDGVEYLKKFDKEINQNYIMNFHPECILQNYDEIECLTKIVRDKDGIIIDDFHRTIPYITKYERTRILGQRAKQINSDSPVFVKVPENVIDGYLIAELELEQKRIPFIIRRPLPNGGSEYWNVKDLENISF